VANSILGRQLGKVQIKRDFVAPQLVARPAKGVVACQGGSAAQWKPPSQSRKASHPRRRADQLAGWLSWWHVINRDLLKASAMTDGIIMRLAILLCGLLFTADAAPADKPSPIRIVVVGDSTVATYKPDPAKPSIAGWGQVLGESFNDQVEVITLAVSGRSSKSFIKEGRWTKALEQRPDYVLIQFGHNDCPGKGDRTTDPNGDYRDYLRQYISETRKAGARPVLITPMARRTFAGRKITSTLIPYAEAMIAVGEAENVPVIDLHTASVELFNRLGDEGSADLSCAPNDRTHFSPKGARKMAELIVQQLPEKEPSLRPYLKSHAPES
jgi:lysophospholipase L1-like esterase